MGRRFVQNFEHDVYQNTLKYAPAGTEPAFSDLVSHLMFCEDCFNYWNNMYSDLGVKVGKFTQSDDHLLDVNEFFTGNPPESCQHGVQFHDNLISLILPIPLRQAPIYHPLGGY